MTSTNGMTTMGSRHGAKLAGMALADKLTPDNAALVLIDHQTGLMQFLPIARFEAGSFLRETPPGRSVNLGEATIAYRF